MSSFHYAFVINKITKHFIFNFIKIFKRVKLFFLILKKHAGHFTLECVKLDTEENSLGQAMSKEK